MQTEGTLVLGDEAGMPSMASSRHSIITSWLTDLTSYSFLQGIIENYALR